MDEDVVPVFAQFGAAVHDAQVLEQGLALLMTLAAAYQGANFPSAPRAALSGREEQKTLGELFVAVRKKEYFTNKEERMIWSAIRERNELVHSFLTERAQAMLTPRGRLDVLTTLTEIREKLRSAGRIVDSLIDHYLREYDTSVESIKERMNQLWVSDADASHNATH